MKTLVKENIKTIRELKEAIKMFGNDCVITKPVTIYYTEDGILITDCPESSLYDKLKDFRNSQKELDPEMQEALNECALKVGKKEPSKKRF